MSEAFIALGANLDEPAQQLERAVLQLTESAKDIRLLKSSPIYQTRPIGVTAQPNFYNMVIKVTTELAPEALLDRLLQVERAMGRKRDKKNGPRLIDLDLLLYDRLVMESLDDNRLTLPHPRMHQRDFVLRPILDIDERVEHPLLQKPIKTLYEQLESTTIIERL